MTAFLPMGPSGPFTDYGLAKPARFELRLGWPPASADRLGWLHPILLMLTLSLLAFAALAQTYLPNGITVAGGNGSGSAPNQFNNPVGVYVDGVGSVYVADATNGRIQKWAVGATSGVTVAGGNGFGEAPNQFGAFGVYVDGSGAIYVADGLNNRILKFPPNSTSATAGVTVAGGNGAGSAANQLNHPSGVYVDGAGSVYVADQFNNRVQKWASGASSGTTVAGGNGSGSNPNQLNQPSGLSADGSGSVYVADAGNNRIQKWASGATSGTTVAGGNSQLIAPLGVYVDGSGAIYVADGLNNRILKFPPNSTSATAGVTVAGGNGTGSAANQLNQPYGVYVDGSGSIYVADTGNQRVQKFIACPTITAQPPTGQALCAGSPLSTSLVTAGTITAYQWFKDGTALTSPASATMATLNLSAVTAASAGNYRLQLASSGCSSLTSTAFSLSVLAAPSGLASASSSTVLVGGTVSLSASGGTAYQWLGSAGTFLSNPTTNPTVTAIIPVSGVQTFTVVITNPAGCSQSLPVSVTALAVADLTPSLFARPSILYGSSAMSVVVNVAEINNQPTATPVILKITKDAKVNLTFPASASSVGGRPVQNSGWSFDNTTPGYYTLTSLAPIPAGGVLSVGLEGLLNPAATMGDLSISATVSSGDASGINNGDADKIQYFPQ